MHLPRRFDSDTGLSAYLSPIAVWALAFGCAIGWGSFVMPGTTFLPKAGPLGSAIGLLIGAAIMLVIGANYSSLMKRYPDAGGAYSFAGQIMGNDHGFLCAWMLILTYIAIIWANSTALSLIIRYVFGDVFCFGFSYQILGYTVYLGEALLSIALLIVVAVLCIFCKRAAASIQVVCSILLFLCVTACFIAVVVHNGELRSLKPAFSSQGSPVMQIIGIVMLAPWAYIGFESISHSSEEFHFPVKKSYPIMVAALLLAALDYIMLVICAGLAVPDGFSGWGEYIASLGSLEGLQGLPTFYAAREAMGNTGLLLLGIAAACAIITAIIGYYIALSRLLNKMARDNVLSHLGRTNKKGVPFTAIITITAISCLIPFLGRTAIGWIVDVTTIGALIVYGYVSNCAFILGKKEKNRRAMIGGIAGVLIALILIAFFILPALWGASVLEPESYLILIVWCLLGMIVFRVLIQRDHKRQMGKSGIVWIILLVMILMISFIWVQQMTTKETADIEADVHAIHVEEAEKAGVDVNSNLVRTTGEYIEKRIEDLDTMTHMSVLVQNLLVLFSIIIIFSIYALIKKREKQIEEEKLFAEENSRAKTTFLSNMSHDIRTPMNAIIGYTSLTKREEISDKARDYLDKIEYSGNHLLAIINDILDMSRIESGKVELEVAPADLCALADGLQDIFGIQMQSKSLCFIIDHSGVTDGYVVCDQNRLNRILMNLVSNAYKFTPEGGSVTVALRQTGRNGDDADFELRVSDTGIGMSPEFAKNIFNAFERERTSTVSKIQGTGLGMSIAKSLIELMGGTIEVDTEQGKGTTFIIRVTFPVAERPIEPEKAADIHDGVEAVDFSDVRLLLVEDNPINSEIACAILIGEGFLVDTAENGKIAVEMIEAAEPHTYAAVLMDVQMPVMDGYEASRAIRALDGERAQVPIIAVSANTFEDDRRAAKEAGMNAHLPKPYSPEKLIEVLSRWIKTDQKKPL